MMTRRVSRKHLLAAAVVMCAISIPPISWAGGSRLHPPVRSETGALRATEVVALATRQEIVSLGIHYEHLIASGIKDEDLQDGSLVVGRVYCCGGSIEHSSAPWVYVPRGMSVEVGDIIEVKMGRKPKKKDPGVVNTAVRVRHKGISNAPCRWAPQQPGLWMRILHCDWMEKEGWVRKKGLYKTWLKKPAKSQKGRAPPASLTKSLHETVKQDNLEEFKRPLGQDASQQTAPGTSYRIGIFPGGGKFGSGTLAGLDQHAVRVLQTNIEKNPALALTYSYYDDLLNEPRIKNPDRLWIGGQINKKPNAELVHRLAHERSLDGVVMYWGRSSGFAYPTSRAIDVYVIDVERRQVNRKKGTNKKSEVDKLTRKVLAQFLANRPQVTQAKATEPTPPVTAKRSPAPATTSFATVAPETASRATPYRMALFPVGGCFGTQYCRGSPEKILRIVQANIKKESAVTLAYSYYDDTLNEPPIKNRDRLWIGGQVKKKPNQNLVYQLARERELDGVVMAWGTGTTQGGSVDLYLIDVADRKVYRQKGTTKKSSMDKLSRKMLAQFLTDRPGVVVAKATPSAPTTVTHTPAPTKKVVTPTVVKIAPPGTVILEAGTIIPVEMVENVNGEINQVGETVLLRVTAPVYVGEHLAIQQGAPVKAEIRSLKQRKSIGKGGDLNLSPVALQAADGQWVSLDKTELGAAGKQRTGKTVGYMVAFGLFGLLAKGNAAVVLRGTQYDIEIRRDALVDTTVSPPPLPSLRQAALPLTAEFKKITKVKFTSGKPGKDIVLDINLTPGLTERPASIEIVQILDYILPKPIRAIDVQLNDKRKVLKATFDWWSVIRHASPGGDTSMIVQVTLSDGRLAEAQPVLIADWKL